MRQLYFESGKLDKYGALKICRNNSEKYTEMECPYASFDAHCSINCPLFGDPRELFGSEKGYEKKQTISICGDTLLVFEKFTNEMDVTNG